MSPKQGRRLALLLLIALMTGCSSDDTGLNPHSGTPIVTEMQVTLNPYNQLSTVVTFGADHVDSARVVYWTGSESPETTPYFPIEGGVGQIATLGLTPTTSYFHTVEAIGGSETSVSQQMEFTTGELPDFLKTVAFDVTGVPTPGYTFTEVGSGGFVIAMDGTGRICWYRELEGLAVGEAGQKPNGNFTAFIGSSTGFQPTFGYYQEFKPSGELVRTYAAGAPLYTDPHELLMTMSGSEVSSVHLYSYDLRRTDMSAFGGPTDALIAGHQILRFSSGGALQFMWNAWDHFELEDWIEFPLNAQQSDMNDFDHPNSLAFDLDGHYIASFRHLAEVTKIHSRTGDIIWRFGGRNNQFLILGDPLDGFNGQHDVRVLENGNILLYDNGLRHDPSQSRAVEYRLDTEAMTATMVWEYRHEPTIFTPFVGSARRLSTGNTLVGFGWVGTAVEVDPAGQVAWEGTLTVGGAGVFAYRFLRIPSLYRYEKP